MQCWAIPIFSILVGILSSSLKYNRTPTSLKPNAPFSSICSFIFLLPLAAQVGMGEDHDYSEDGDELLAEIIAEEEKDAEEMAKLEAQMRELEEMKVQQQEMKERKHQSAGIPGATNEKFLKMEERLRNQEAAAKVLKQETNARAQLEAERIKAEKTAAEREAKFQAELARTKDEKRRKELEKQKAKDAKIVKKILKYGNKGQHYALLGFTCKWGEFNVGPLKLCSIKNGEIKKAYRNMARQVHPDKNRDGRAEEAFNLLELSSSILLDEKKRKAYNLKLKMQRQELLKHGFHTINQTTNVIAKLIRTSKTVLGPFFTPIFILVALII